MALSDSKLEAQLKDVGDKLLNTQSSTDELVHLLDETEHLLINVEQAPSGTMQDALLSPMTALISWPLLRHSDSQVKISVASCLCEITRITAPDAPYNDDQMKEIFQLMISALGKLSNVSNQGYEKAVSILVTVAKVKACLVMLDLELDELVLDMFRLFVRVISYDHSPNVYQAMETIMSLVIKESEEISLDLLLVLLSSVRKEVQNVSPRAWKLGTKVMTNCATKIKKYLQDAVRLGYVSLDDYGLIVSSICQEGNKVSCDNKKLDSHNNGQVGNEDGRKLKMEPETVKKKRGRKPNSMRNPEEGYEHSWISPGQKSGELPNGRKPNTNTISESKGSNHPAKKNLSGSRAVDRGSVSDDGNLRSQLRDRSELNVLPKQSTKYDKEDHVFEYSKLEERDDILEKDQSWISKKARKDQSVETVLDEHIYGASGAKAKSLKRHRSYSDEFPKNESKRKRRMKKETSSGMPDLGEKLIGRRIKVWWPMDKTFYEGVVDDFDPVKRRHRVLYVDGDKEVLNLRKQRWELIGSTSILQEALEEAASKDVTLLPPASDDNSTKAKRRKRRKYAADAEEWGLRADGTLLLKRSPRKRAASEVQLNRDLEEEGAVAGKEASPEEPQDGPFAETDAADNKVDNLSPLDSKEGTPDGSLSRQDEISGAVSSDNGSSGNIDEVSGEMDEF